MKGTARLEAKYVVCSTGNVRLVCFFLLVPGLIMFHDQMLRKFDALKKKLCFEKDQNVWRMTLSKLICALVYVQHDLSVRYCHNFMSVPYRSRQHVLLMFRQP
jgi:hypothetical protein